MISVLVALLSAAVPSAASPSPANTLVFCASGRAAGLIPLPPPPSLDLNLAVAVVEINSPMRLRNVGVSGFALVHDGDDVTTLKHIVKVEEFDDYSVAEEDGLFAHYMDRAETRPWNGTIPAGKIRLRIQAAFVDSPRALPQRCRLTVGPYTIEGSSGGEWPTS